jgi:hypothetical protein
VPTHNRRTTLLIAAMAGAAVIVSSAGTALAISGGGYRVHKMGCSAADVANSHEDKKQDPGCHDVNIVISSGGHTYAEIGTNTTEEGDNVHAGNILIAPDGSGNARGGASGKALKIRWDSNYQPIPGGECGLFDLLTYPIDLLTGHACKLDPAAWKLPGKLPSVTPTLTMGHGKGGAPSLTHLKLYFGADDGLDTGEHDEPNGKDGTKTEQNGPSDGGAIVLTWHPMAVSQWLPRVLTGLEHANLAPLARNPLPFLSTGFGACADGICISAQSRRTESLRGGGGGGKSRDVYDYQGKTFDPYTCSGASVPAEKQCHDATHKNEDAFLKAEAKHVYLEPGIQLFEDPDPNGSPLLPTYPLPAIYLGSCGVTIGGGPLKLPASPLTNSAGQLSISPSHC